MTHTSMSTIPTKVWRRKVSECAALKDTNAELLAALEGFVEQATKLQGFPQLYDPYVGAVLKAKVAIAKARDPLSSAYWGGPPTAVR